MVKNKLNILRIVYDWYEEGVNTQGLAPAPYNLSVAQAKLGHKIFVFCGNLTGKAVINKRFFYTLEQGRIVVYNLPRALFKFGPFLTTSIFVPFYYFYLKITKKLDLVHNHGHLGVYFLLYKFLFGWVDKTPVLGHFHITAKGREQALVNQGTKLDFFTKYFEYPIHKLSDYLSKYVCNEVVVVSKDLKNELVNLYGFNPSKIKILESAVDTFYFKKDGPKVNLGFNKNSKIILNVGRLSKRKNIHLIVESLKYLPSNYKLVLIGSWESDSYKTKVESIIKHNHLQKRIKYLGSIPNSKISAYFRSCDFFVLPSSYEGLPKVVLEALSSGLKVVASGFSMQHNVSNIYYIKNLNSKNIANTLLKIDKLPNRYKSTFKIIDKYYSWNSKAQELNSIYAKILK